MLGTFLDKVSGFFDRRFIIAYWSPTLIFLSLALGLGIFPFAPSLALSWWQQLSGTEQVLLTGGVLLGNTLLAYLLEAMEIPLIRLYEGYWPEWVPLTRPARRRRQNQLERILQQLGAVEKQKVETKKQLAATLPDQISLRIKLNRLLLHQELSERQLRNALDRFPRDPGLVKPTRLGNLLAAAEEYSYQLYQLDAVLWWPRLAPLLPSKFRSEIDGALTPVLALLNLSLGFTILGIGGGVAILLSPVAWWWGVLVLVIGLLVAWTCYSAAVNRVVDYGNLIRVSFDLYRQNILQQMHIPVPDNLQSERLLWTALNHWVSRYTPPWESEWVKHAPQLAEPFYYDTNQMILSKSTRKRGQPPLQMAPISTEPGDRPPL
jgi:hypothetical protein